MTGQLPFFIVKQIALPHHHRRRRQRGALTRKVIGSIHPGVSWCQSVKFGNLEVQQPEGTNLWPAQNNWVKKAFFQATALQLSMNCVNNENAIPDSIASEYNTLQAFLSQLTYTDIQNGTFPSGVDTTGVRDGAGTIGRWICANHCNSVCRFDRLFRILNKNISDSKLRNPQVAEFFYAVSSGLDLGLSITFALTFNSCSI